MKIFPLGEISAASSSGTIDSISYSLFEPNSGCFSIPVYSTLSTRFEQQSVLTRKKASPFISVSYSYDGIFSREYRQLDHFVYSIDDALTSFYVIAFDRGITPSSITDSSSDWVCAIDNTRYFSTVTNKKAFKAVVWDGRNWKEGSVTALVANTSITLDVDTNNYGALSLADAQDSGIVYPLYEVYLSDNAMNNFKTVNYIHETINTSKDGGHTWSGNIDMIGKYYV